MRARDPNTAEEIDASDTYRVNAISGRPTSVATRPAMGDKTNNPPQPEAIPLPPLNRINTGQLWPNTTARAAAASTPGESKKIRATTTASTALPISRNSTTTATGVPTVRWTLVIPMLPLPCSRMSTLPANLPAISPKGTEPNRYAIGTSIR